MPEVEDWTATLDAICWLWIRNTRLEVDKIAMQDRIWIIAVLRLPAIPRKTRYDIRRNPASAFATVASGLEHRRQSGQTGC